MESKTINILSIACLIILLLGCQDSDKSTTSTDSLTVPIESLRNGDLAFRCGTSLESRLVTSLDNKNGPYSHIGIIANINGTWFVIHAVPGESQQGEPDVVKMDSIHEFFNNDRARIGAIMRATDDSAKCTIAVNYALWAAKVKKRFDSDFDWNDTTKLYCTEFVQQAYLHAGIDLAQDHRTEVGAAMFKGSYVFPLDIAINDSIRKICDF